MMRPQGGPRAGPQDRELSQRQSRAQRTPPVFLMAYAAYWTCLHGGTLLDAHLPSRFSSCCPIAVSKCLQSQSGTTPKPAAPVSHYEQKPSSGSNMASKATAAGSDVTATGSASKSGASAQAKTSTTSEVKVPTKTTSAPTSVKSEPAKTTKPTTTTTTATATSTTTKPASTTATATSTTTKPTSTTATPTSTTTKPTSTTATPTSTTTTTTTTTTASKTPATKAEKTQVQVEVPPKAKETKAAPPLLDPLDALASSLPSEAPKCPEPKYTGPEVEEEKVKPEKGVRVGEREDTLPPGYRLRDMAPVPADVKPAEVPKPLSTDDALDVLSEGFLSEPAPKVETIGAASKAQTNFAAVPQPPKKSEPAAPPADKKAKLDAASDSFSLSAAVPAAKPSKPQTSTVKAPSMDADALGALEDLLPTAEPPKPEAPLRPDQMVKEATVEGEKGVRVGEREDTLPPEYRLKPEDKDLPPPQPEPSLSTPDALDFLSDDFSFSSAPTSQSAAPAPAQKPVSAPLDKKPRLESEEFSLEAGLTPTSVQKVQSAAVPPLKKSETKPAKSEEKPKDVTDSKPALGKEGSMSLDALEALEDLLPTVEPPKPEAPLRPDQMVKEAMVEEEEGVRVGEREDTLPPEYRRKPEDKDLPPPQPEPSLSTPDALDFLSGDFSSSSAPTTQSAAPAPAQAGAGDALDLLSGDFLAASAAPTMQSSFCPPEASLEVGADSALDALSDSLKDIAPTPQPEPPMPTNVVKERDIEEERLIRLGERDDTLPPEYRLTEEERKKMEEEKNKVPESPREAMDDTTALDLLAGDFSSAPAPAAPSAPEAPSAPVSSSASAPVCSDPKEANKPMAGKSLDALSETLVSDLKKSDKPEKSKKSQAEGAVDLLSSQLSSDVVPTTTKKS